MQYSQSIHINTQLQKALELIKSKQDPVTLLDVTGLTDRKPVKTPNNTPTLKKE